MIPTLKLNDQSDIPVFGMGTWELLGGKCTQAIGVATKLGVTHIDTAVAYKNQKLIGAAISGLDRSKLFLTSKIFYNSLKYDQVLNGAKEILSELGVSWIDLLLIHWPNKNVSMKETFSAFRILHEEGRVRSFGVSNFTIRHLEEALSLSEVPIVLNQVEFHPYLYQKELLEFCKNHGLVVTAYSPLARGRILQDEVIEQIGKSYYKTPTQVCLRWLLQHGLVVIPKATTRRHIEENLGCFGWELSQEDMSKIDTLNKNQRFVIPSFAEF